MTAVNVARVLCRSPSGTTTRLELAAAQGRLHAGKVQRRDDVVRDDQRLLGRRAVERRLVEQVGPDMDRVAALTEIYDDGFHAPQVLK